MKKGSNEPRNTRARLDTEGDTLPLTTPKHHTHPSPHLRRKVRYRSAVGAHRRSRAVEITQPEIGEFYLAETATTRQEHVVQLHVAMANVLVVRVAHSADDLNFQRERSTAQDVHTTRA